MIDELRKMEPAQGDQLAKDAVAGVDKVLKTHRTMLEGLSVAQGALKDRLDNKTLEWNQQRGALTQHFTRLERQLTTMQTIPRDTMPVQLQAIGRDLETLQHAVHSISQRDSNVAEGLRDLRREHGFLEESIATLRREMERKVEIRARTLLRTVTTWRIAWK